jgi:hypothetical protein
MDEILHANIFFIISSVATVLFFVIICFVMYQVFKILKLVRSILERVESASEVVARDMADFRGALVSRGWFARLINLVLGAASGASRRKRSDD